ncbi:hypothetical protein E2C01_032327 [Portunus trituberculatus]|uniref:Uncharacterized protein n=1 Tax=Portunus trituberculatus TaxID=210409 RepID=A0A5B7EVQ6_PORTR|nr:hypothetical protein [Portunus trituberculatus]
MHSSTEGFKKRAIISVVQTTNCSEASYTVQTPCKPSLFSLSSLTPSLSSHSQGYQTHDRRILLQEVLA